MRVVAPGRLHMGFIDPSGSLERRFCSIGVGLNEIATQLTLHVSDTLVVQGPQAERARHYLQELCKALALPDNVYVKIDTAIPDHVGLGSGTQMSLAIGVGLSRLYGLDLSVRALAQLTNRGGRSGIGIAVFEQGGFVIDGGRSGQTLTPPVISNIAFPAEWRFILVLDESGKGFHGDQELKAFDDLPLFPQTEIEHLCFLILMQALPALAEQNLARFGHVITELQQSVGNYFAAAQGGCFTSPAVEMAINWLGERGAVALGQSSWGPTGFCLVDGAQKTDKMLKEVKKEFAHQSTLRFISASARNKGGLVDVVETAFDVVSYQSDSLINTIGN